MKPFPFIAVSLIALAACTDSSLEGPDAGRRSIRFNVSAPSSGVESRGGSSLRAVGAALTVKGSDSPLYLIPEVRNGVGFMDKGSRSERVTSSSIEDFGVYASISVSGAPYMENVEVTRENDWTPEREYLWPGKGSLRFVAYSPYGVTRAGADGKRFVDFTTPASVADQTSLLWASPIEASASPCALTFHNALTAVRFAAGAELAPCTVKSIRIYGVPSSGSLDIESGEWSDVTSPESFAIEPDVTIEAAPGSKYVAEGTPLMADDETFLLIPGVLPVDARIEMTISANGVDSELSASIGATEWIAGTTVTYRLSANPSTSGLTLDVIGKLETQYPGQTVPFLVRSALVGDDGDSIAVSWKAEFLDADDNVLDGMPDWMLRFPTQGMGHDDLTASTRMQDLTFIKLSPESQILQNTPSINRTSGHSPYNLANRTGAAADENTANCYIINAPGDYSFPLVYGNALKDGADNKSAYTSTSHSALAMKTFCNHLGNAITSPYIYENSGCKPSDAYLVWEGRLDLIRNVALSADGKRITFTVPEKSIRQGNAMIALRDTDGNIMWSWNIWVTDYRPETETVAYTSGSKTYTYYTRNIGRIMGGDITKFPRCEIKVRFTQTDVPDGLEPLSVTVPFTQTGITIETSDCYNFYQWGRKDPIKSSLKEWFDAGHYEIKSIKTAQLPSIGSGENYMPFFIKNPDIFYKADHSQKFTYSNLWNSTLSSADNVKTIYDPSPVGAKVPLGNGLLAIARDASVVKTFGAATSGIGSMGLYLDFSSGDRMFLPELGYRSGGTGNDAQGIGSIGTLWLAQTTGSASSAKVEARCVVIRESDMQQNTNPRTHGFAIRPILE